MATDRLYLRDAYLETCLTTVVGIDGDRVATEATVFYPTGGGQPHDTGTLTVTSSPGGPVVPIVGVSAEGDLVWHRLEMPASDAGVAVGSNVELRIDWDRRHALMRTHTALHLLCGVIYHTYGVSVTGGNMEPLSARMDFEFDPLPEGFAAEVQARLDAEVAADRPIEVSFLPRAVALADHDLIRTKVNLVPESVDVLRVVDIVGLDKQADGGTHVGRTAEVGRVQVIKTESKGKAFKRVRIAVTDAGATGELAATRGDS